LYRHISLLEGMMEVYKLLGVVCSSFSLPFNFQLQENSLILCPPHPSATHQIFCYIDIRVSWCTRKGHVLFRVSGGRCPKHGFFQKVLCSLNCNLHQIAMSIIKGLNQFEGCLLKGVFLFNRISSWDTCKFERL